MAYGGLKIYMDAAAELGRNPVNPEYGDEHNQPEYIDEQADAGRACRTRLARPNSQATNADKEILIFPVQLTMSRNGNLTRLIHTLLALYVCVTIHTKTSYGTLYKQ